MDLSFPKNQGKITQFVENKQMTLIAVDSRRNAKEMKSYHPSIKQFNTANEIPPWPLSRFQLMLGFLLFKSSRTKKNAMFRTKH